VLISWIGFTVTLSDVNQSYHVKGPKGEISRDFKFPQIESKVDGDLLKIETRTGRKEQKMFIFTMIAHLKNMFKGVTEGFEYKLKICSGHFPMNVSLKGDEFVVKNYLGEKIPRVLKIKSGADVKISEPEIVVTGIDKEIVGQVAADIEQLTRITNRDIRIFQDGIYIIEKAGKKL